MDTNTTRLDEVRSSAEKAISDLIALYQRNPWDFLYESDIQGALSGRLRAALPADLSVPDGSITRHFNRSKTEYPSSERFDAAIVAPEIGSDAYTQSPCGYCDEDMRIWQLPVLIAVELKHLVRGFRAAMQYSGLEADIVKMDNYRSRSGLENNFCGVALLFVQDQPEWDELQRLGKNRTLKWDADVFALDEAVTGWVIAPKDENGIWRVAPVITC